MEGSQAFHQGPNPAMGFDKIEFHQSGQNEYHFVIQSNLALN